MNKNEEFDEEPTMQIKISRAAVGLLLSMEHLLVADIATLIKETGPDKIGSTETVITNRKSLVRIMTAASTLMHALTYVPTSEINQLIKESLIKSLTQKANDIANPELEKERFKQAIEKADEILSKVKEEPTIKVTLKPKFTDDKNDDNLDMN